MGDRALLVASPAVQDNVSYQEFELSAGEVYELAGVLRTADVVNTGGGIARCALLLTASTGSYTLLEAEAPYIDGARIGLVPAVGLEREALVRLLFRVTGSGWFAVHTRADQLIGQCFFDDITLRRLSPGVTIGGWRGEKGLTDNGELALDLPAGIRQSDGVSARVLAKGHVAGNCRHGEQVNFPVPFQNVPMVLIRGGIGFEPRGKWGLNGDGTESNPSNYTTEPQYDDVAALDLDANGFRMRARLRRKGGVPVARAHNFPASNNLAVPGQSTERNLDFAPANNDTYTAHLSVSVTANAASGFKNDVSLTIAIDTDDALGGGWQERATRTYTATGKLGPVTTTVAHAEIPVVVSGLTGIADIRIRIKDWNPGPDGGSFTVHGYDGIGDSGLPGVTYNTSADSYASKTPDVDDRVYWEAIEVS